MGTNNRVDVVAACCLRATARVCTRRVTVLGRGRRPLPEAQLTHRYTGGCRSLTVLCVLLSSTTRLETPGAFSAFTIFLSPHHHCLSQHALSRILCAWCMHVLMMHHHRVHCGTECVRQRHRYAARFENALFVRLTA